MSDRPQGHGGLIRREKRVERKPDGSTITQHWDGRKDVNVVAQPVRARGRIEEK